MWQAFADVSFTGDKPNHILALAYTKACAGKGIALTQLSVKVRVIILKISYISLLLPQLFVNTFRTKHLWISLFLTLAYY